MGVFEDVISQTSRRPSGLPGVLERRREARAPLLRTSRASMTSHLWELELVPAFGLERLSRDIDLLSERSVEKNLFFQSAVLRAAWPRLTNLLAPRGAWMLCLWETQGDGRKLRLFMPLRINKVGFPRQKVLQPLSNEFMPVGTPLIDRECAGEAAETLLRLIADPILNLPPVIDFTHQKRGGESFEILLRAANSLGLKSCESASHERAALIASQITDPENGHALPRKAVRELKRQQRRAGETGKLGFEAARKNAAVLDAFEHFMTLELKGWKGRKGTALYNHKKIAAFSRQIVAELVARGECEIFSMKLDQKTIGALIMLGSKGRMVPWKMAFDETRANISPGMQIMLYATGTLIGRKSFIEADSLAVEDHWMMNRIWPHRIVITDLAIALVPEANRQLETLSSAKQRLHKLKQWVKTWVSSSKKGLRKLLQFS